jgi:hypothetical protein
VAQKNIVLEILNKIENGISPEIIFYMHCRSRDRKVLLAGVQMKNREMATRLRLNLPAKKAGQDYGKIQITNCVPLATRVRIDVLIGMAKKITTIPGGPLCLWLCLQASTTH